MRSKKANKYNARKVNIDGILFDSRAEGKRYKELKILEDAGEIEGLVLQPRFLLQDKFYYKNKCIRKIEYIADFKYREKSSDMIVVEDVKGVETKDFKIKMKMFLKLYGDEIDFRIKTAR